MSSGWLASFDEATLDGAALTGFDESAPPATYYTLECLTFFKTGERWGGFSNMASGFPLGVNGITIRSSEAIYQACRFPHLPEVQREVIAQTNPMVAKMKSRKHHSSSRHDFYSLRVPIMWWSLRVKLACNAATFAPLLLATGGGPWWNRVPATPIGVPSRRKRMTEYSSGATSLADC